MVCSLPCNRSERASWTPWEGIAAGDTLPELTHHSPTHRTSPTRTNTHVPSLVPRTPCCRRVDPGAHGVGYPPETPLPPPAGCHPRKCPPPSVPRAPPVWSPAPPVSSRDTRLPRPWGRPGTGVRTPVPPPRRRALPLLSVGFIAEERDQAKYFCKRFEGRESLGSRAISGGV